MVPVRGHCWHVVGVIVVTAIIAFVVSAILALLWGNLASLNLILRIVGQVLVDPFVTLVSVLLYLDPQARSERFTASALRSELARP